MSQLSAPLSWLTSLGCKLEGSIESHDMCLASTNRLRTVSILVSLTHALWKGMGKKKCVVGALLSARSLLPILQLLKQHTCGTRIDVDFLLDEAHGCVSKKACTEHCRRTHTLIVHQQSSAAGAPALNKSNPSM